MTFFLKIFDITNKKKIVGLHKNVSRLFQQKENIGFCPSIAGMDSASLFWINYTERSAATNCSHGFFFWFVNTFLSQTKTFSA